MVPKVQNVSFLESPIRKLPYQHGSRNPFEEYSGMQSERSIAVNPYKRANKAEEKAK